MKPSEEIIRYKRSRFSTRLPVARIYTRSHYWLREDEAGGWRIGLTKFATRMLGDLVEFELSVSEGDPVEVGDKVGWIEGFKAVSELYAVANGSFAGGNAALSRDITLLESDPYGEGWLYRIDGEPEPGGLSAEDYIHVLDATIEKMLANRGESDA